MSGERRVIVTCMKNECPYILEWIAYHLEIGFTHFVVATNGCADGTVRMLRNLERAGLVTHVANPPPHRRGPQKTGYFRCRDVLAVREADWLMTLDVDEFVNIYVGDGTLDALFAAAPGANMVSFQWLMFGHNRQIAFQDRLVIEQFSRSADPLQRLPTLVRAFKTLYRAELYEKLGTHRPNVPVPVRREDIRWVDGSGQPMPAGYIDRGWAGELDGQGLGIRLGRINHYAVRSVESFLIKRDRGDVNPLRQHAKNRDNGMSYWKLHDWNLVEDHRILRHVEAVQRRIDALRTLPRVADMHELGTAWHRAKAAELAGREDMIALKSDILEFSRTPRQIEPSWLFPEEAAERFQQVKPPVRASARRSELIRSQES